MGEDDPRGILVLLTTFTLVIVLLPVVIDLFTSIGIMFVGDNTVYVHGWLTTVFAYLPLLILLIIYVFASLRPPADFGLFFSSQLLGKSIAAGVFSAMMIFAIDIASDTLVSFDVPSDPSIMIMLGFIVSWGVLAPAVEELLFRGFIQTIFTEKIQSTWKIHPAIFIATGFEVLMHLSIPLSFSTEGSTAATIGATLPQLSYVAFFGLIAGFVYYRTRSLTGPFIIHALGNIGELVLFWFFF